ncbi:MAG: response regulator transcription factor [Arenicella sp.]
MRVLIVEDNIALAQNLNDYFNGENYTLDFASDGLTALNLIANNTYDVIALDINLPGVNGFEICHRLRSDMQSNTPVIMMTASGEIESKVEGFQFGADDYIVKPFQLRELQLRIDALYKRSNGIGTSIIKIENLTFNQGTLEVCLDGLYTIELSGMGANIFQVIIHGYPNYIAYGELRHKLWGDRELDVNVLRTHVYSLRKTLKEGLGQELIKTVHGRGYKLNFSGESQ